jgi:uncharacterized RDD family membrane protein YckC
VVYTRGAIPPGFTLSSGGKRFGAYLLNGLLFVVTLGIGWIIWAIILWGHGQTPAMQLLHMRIYDLNTGRGASWGPMALRNLVGFHLLGNITCGITTLVGGIMILSDVRRQAIWDKIANTVVLEDPYNQLDPDRTDAF